MLKRKNPNEKQQAQLREALLKRQGFFNSSFDIAITPLGLPTDKDLKPMSLTTFCAAIDRMMAMCELRSVTILGNEPLLWAELAKAIDYAKAKGLSVILRTSGQPPQEVRPDLLQLVINTTKKTELQPIVAHYKKFTKISLHHYFGIDFDGAKLAELIQSAEENSIPLFLYPHPAFQSQGVEGLKIKLPEFGNNWLELLKKWRQSSAAKTNTLGKKRPRLLGSATYLCLFDKKIHKELQKEYGLCGACDDCFLRKITIHADGDSISYCPRLPPMARLRDSLSLTTLLEEKILPEIQKLQTTVPTDCQPCVYFKKKKCFHGCLAGRK